MGTKTKSPLFFVILTAFLTMLVTFSALYFGDENITIVPDPGALPDVVLGEAVSDLLISVGIAPVIAALIELAKLLNWLPDGSAGKVQAIGQALAYMTIIAVTRLGGIDPTDPNYTFVFDIVLRLIQLGISVVGAVGIFKSGRVVKLALAAR